MCECAKREMSGRVQWTRKINQKRENGGKDKRTSGGGDKKIRDRERGREREREGGEERKGREREGKRGGGRERQKKYSKRDHTQLSHHTTTSLVLHHSMVKGRPTSKKNSTHIHTYVHTHIYTSKHTHKHTHESKQTHIAVILSISLNRKMKHSCRSTWHPHAHLGLTVPVSLTLMIVTTNIFISSETTRMTSGMANSTTQSTHKMCQHQLTP